MHYSIHPRKFGEQSLLILATTNSKGTIFCYPLAFETKELAERKKVELFRVLASKHTYAKLVQLGEDKFEFISAMQTNIPGAWLLKRMKNLI